MTHTARHAAYVSNVAESLIGLGIHGFVAHVSIDISKEWADEIDEALRTCDVLASFIHDHFQQSAWTDQEVGYALHREIPVLPLNYRNGDPHGFLGFKQAMQCHSLNAEQAAAAIQEALMVVDQARLVESMIEALGQSRNFKEANSGLRRFGVFPTQAGRLSD